MESEEPFGDEMPNFDICGTVFKELFEGIDVLDGDAKTETAASSEINGRKSTENEKNKRKRSIVILEDDEIEELQRKQVAKNTAKELKVLFVVLKPGSMIDMVRSSCCQVSTKLMQATY